VDKGRVAGGRRRLRGGIEGSVEIEQAAQAYSLGADGLALLEADDVDRAIKTAALHRADEIAETRLAVAIQRAIGGD
jgi:hypothetical protein